MFNNKKMISLACLAFIIGTLYYIKDLWFGLTIKIISGMFPFLIGIFFALIANVVVEVIPLKIDKNKKRIIVIFGILLFISLFFSFLIPNIIHFWNHTIPKITLTVNKLSNNYIGTKFNLSSFLSNFVSNTSNIFNIASNITATTLQIVTSIVVFLITIFEIDKYKQFLKVLLLKYSKSVYDLFATIDSEFVKYIKGLSKYTGFIFIYYLLIIFMLNFDDFNVTKIISFALFMALLIWIPVVGHYVGLILISLLSIDDINITLIIIKFIAFFIAIIVDTNFIQPKILSKSININVLMILVVVTVSLILFGTSIILFLPLIIIIANVMKNVLYKKIIGELK